DNRLDEDGRKRDLLAVLLLEGAFVPLAPLHEVSHVAFREARHMRRGRLAAHHMVGDELAHAVHLDDLDVAGGSGGRGWSCWSCWSLWLSCLWLDGLTAYRRLPTANSTLTASRHIVQDILLGHAAFGAGAGDVFQLGHADAFLAGDVEH